MKALFYSMQAGGMDFLSEANAARKTFFRRCRLFAAALLIAGVCGSTQPASWPALVRQTFQIALAKTAEFWDRLVSTPEAASVAPLPAAATAPVKPAVYPRVRVTGMRCRTNSSRMDYVFHFEGSVEDSAIIAGGALVIARLEVGKDVIMAQTQTKPDGTYSLEVPFTSHLYERVDWSLSTQSVEGKFIETSGRHILTSDDRQIRIDTDGKFQIAER